MAVQLCHQVKDGGRESEKHPAVLCSRSRAVFGEPSSQSALRGAPCPPGMGLPSNPCCDQPRAGSSPLESRPWPKSENQFQSPAAAALGQLTSSSWKSARRLLIAPHWSNMFLFLEVHLVRWFMWHMLCSPVVYTENATKQGGHYITELMVSGLAGNHSVPCSHVANGAALSKAMLL